MTNRRLFLLGVLSLIAVVSAGCQSTCGSHLDCAADEYCSSGACKAMGDLFRKPCSTLDDCGEGYCISGYCYKIGEQCSCDPRDPCTASAPSCEGACAEAVDCQDANPCTDDACVDQKCVNTPNDQVGCCTSNADCDDGSPCTRNVCDDHQCAYPIDPEGGCCQTSLDCDDANPCTADACGDDGTCSHETSDTGCCVADADCDDADPCTSDFCAGNRCLSPRTVDSELCACQSDADCDDANPCSLDACTANRCGYLFDATGVLAGVTCCDTDALCNDGNGNTDDRCEHNVCTHELRVTCDKASDCFELDPCALYTCANGFCILDQVLTGCCTSALQCDDSDDCTKDTCASNLCKHEFTANPGCCQTDGQCDDGESCTTDTCCTDLTCDSTAGVVPMFHCLHEASGTNCCTNDAECKDDNWCTTDTCVDFACQHTPKTDCCYFEEDCDDGVWCTDDSCTEGSCVNARQPGCCLDEGECDDTNPCTYDYCINHTCQYEAKSHCCAADGDCVTADPCIKASCQANTCVYAPTPGCCQPGDACDDGDPCTKDQCSSSKCVHLADPNPFCCQPTVLATAQFDGVDAFPFDLSGSSTQVTWVVDAFGAATSGAGALRYHNAATSGYNTPGSPNSGTALSAPVAIPWEDNITIGFQLFGDIRSDPATDKLTLSVHDGTSFVKVWDKSQTPNGLGAAFQPIWITSDFLAGKTIRLKFEMDTVDAGAVGQGVFLDDVIVGYGCKYGTVTCVANSDCVDDDPCTDDECQAGTCAHISKGLDGCCGAPALTSTFGSLPGNGSATSAVGGVQWGLSSQRFVSGPTALYFGNPSTHTYDAPGQTVTGTYTLSAVNLGGVGSPVLSFQVWMYVEQYPFTDKFWLEVNGTEVWTKKTPGVSLAGPTGWIPVTVDLSPWAGQTVTLAFRFDTLNASSNTYEGVYIDDLVVGPACQ